MNTNNEQWKPISFTDKPALNGLYEISNMGRVRRLTRGHRYPAGFLLSPRPFSSGNGAHQYRLADADGIVMGLSVHSLMTVFWPHRAKRPFFGAWAKWVAMANGKENKPLLAEFTKQNKLSKADRKRQRQKRRFQERLDRAPKRPWLGEQGGIARAHRRV